MKQTKFTAFISILWFIAVVLFTTRPALGIRSNGDTPAGGPPAAAADTATLEQPASSAPEKQPASAPRQLTLAVFDFADTGIGAHGVGRAVADMLIGRLAEDPLVRIFERQRLDEIMEEQKRTNPSDMEGNSLRAAQMVGVQFVLMGKVSEFGISENGVLIPGQGTVTKYKARATLDVRLVNVADAAVIKTWNITGSDTSFNLGVNILGLPDISVSGSHFEDSLLGKATRRAVDGISDMIKTDTRGPDIQNLVQTLKRVGRVADVDGNNLILNIGRQAGVEWGLSMGIYRVNKTVRDPDTGETLTEKRERIGRLLVLHVEEKYSEAAVMKLEPDAEVSIGDLVIEENETDAPGAYTSPKQ